LENPTADSSVNPEAPHPVLLADRPVNITPIKATKTKSKKTAPAPTKVAGAAKTAKVKAASADPSVKAEPSFDEVQRKNSTLRTDAELIASITQHVSDADKFSTEAGASSVKALIADSNARRPGIPI